ncbi:uncharacterized protein TOT_010000910 [Theileria orientalis strain Shintoku]|uniref:Vacuolar protein-sorting-associated protein 36 n=1 Tax=Theileria orientalis strain Shintoku TaxID=869250 RepID=J4D6A6_THEOR|nr:uncharacterized protein TOT_010000910 [Theileria orientalis strain Shintoku]BAM39455.1 uncharacterized protein TOT_010000910 [Theileria orientalis strain Shintoku]|eukprot:XP_009689756.1 uncharacterized protein TOT_010000910 [Theileria orientalis strain Shintoku]
MRFFSDLTSSYLRSMFNNKFNFSRSNVYETFFGLKGENSISIRNFSTRSKNDLLKDWKNYREASRSFLTTSLSSSKFAYDPNSLSTLPKSYESHIQNDVKLRSCLGVNPLFTHYVNPLSIVKFTTKYLLSFRFFFIYMARTTFQAARPLLAFCVFGEIMKLVLANLSGGLPAYLFSFVLAFEVFYFFLQLYISYTFLMMFFTVIDKIVEETVLVLEQLKVGIGVLKRFYDCTEGVLTSYRLSFKYYNNRTRTVYISSITSVKISNAFFQEYILLQSGAIRYYISCSEVEKLYSELLRLMKLNEENQVLSRTTTIGGISRVESTKKEKIEEAESVHASISNLKELKKKTQTVKNVLVKLTKCEREGFNKSIDQIFKKLGVENVFKLKEETVDKEVMEQIRKLASVVLAKNETVLLYELYCATNRLTLSSLLKPAEFFEYVRTLESQGHCTVHKIGRTYLLTRSTKEDGKEDLCKDLLQLVRTGPTDCSRLAREKNIPASLALLKLSVAEKSGLVVRDDAVGQSYYYYNHFVAYQITQ